MAVAEIPAGGTSGRHTHPGIELAYVLDGTVSLEHEGEKAVTYKAGEAMKNVAVIHNATNPGKKPSRFSPSISSRRASQWPNRRNDTMTRLRIALASLLLATPVAAQIPAR